MNSCLYEADVMHHRFRPKSHHFNYKVFMFYLNLDQLPTLNQQHPLIGINHFNLYSFYERDYLPDETRLPLKSRLSNYLQSKDITLGNGTVMLLSNLRVLGYVFNPVSFYFCFNNTKKPLCVVAEVGNTFYEKKLFLVPLKSSGEFDFRSVEEKLFYVSPFSQLDLAFDFRLNIPATQLNLFINSTRANQPVLASSVRGKVLPLNLKTLLIITLKYPLMTWKIIMLIHFHALLLWLKKIPFFSKESSPEKQKAVLNPHASLPQQ
jgi:DUF1365 family protein